LGFKLAEMATKAAANPGCIVLSDLGFNHESLLALPETCEICDAVGKTKLHSISHNVASVRSCVVSAARAAQRDPDEVCLIAVSKRQPARAIEEAHGAGLKDFGENYLQEALPKIAALGHLPLTWHFIGALQSNKTRQVARHFDWVHTVDRPKIARRLNEQCPDDKTLQVCLQVNIDADPGKAGVDPAAVADLLKELVDLERICVRGLMTILDPNADAPESFARMAKLFAGLAPLAAGRWDTLSMGMSNDYEQAIMAGATHVRIGTAIFGAREG
jgi:pyridoxal phosphate enzyme (YggS family)